MSTHYLSACWDRLAISTFDFLLPSGLSNLSISLGIGFDLFGEIGEETLRAFMGEVLGMPKGNLLPLFRVIDQKTGTEVVL
jgi:hypothetical protein